MTHIERKLPSAPKLVEVTFDYVAHPLAELLPMIEAAEFAKLKADIAKQGILIPIMLYEGKILDGRNRYRAATECGHHFVAKDFSEFSGTYDQAHAFVVSTNLQRRQLTNAQKQDFIRKMIEKYPTLSNRKIARDYCGGMSHATVAAVREKMVRPPEALRFERFKETWEDLPDGHREEFVKESNEGKSEDEGMSGGKEIIQLDLHGKVSSNGQR